MRSYIYKTIIFSLALILIFEFTIGRRFNQINEKIERFSSKEGRKDTIASLKKEIKKANEKENYLDEEERILIKEFIIKIQKELDLK
jgi:hypothetical protein|tara:strand:- start:8045 stop:8305 length:261 start_codon:yes stop_codon:yes gene_type:complete